MPKLTRDMTDQEFIDHMKATAPTSPVVCDPARLPKPMPLKALGIKATPKASGASPSGSKGSVPRVVAGPQDEASRMVRECFSDEDLVALCKRHRIDPTLVTTAPNRGVAKMRVSNALRKLLKNATA
jgi:hypothetical protein